MVHQRGWNGWVQEILQPLNCHHIHIILYFSKIFRWIIWEFHFQSLNSITIKVGIIFSFQTTYLACCIYDLPITRSSILARSFIQILSQTRSEKAETISCDHCQGHNHQGCSIHPTTCSIKYSETLVDVTSKRVCEIIFIVKLSLYRWVLLINRNFINLSINVRDSSGIFLSVQFVAFVRKHRFLKEPENQ